MAGENRSTRRKTVRVPFCSAKFPHELPYEENVASALRNRKITTSWHSLRKEATMVYSKAVFQRLSKAKKQITKLDNENSHVRRSDARIQTIIPKR